MAEVSPHLLIAADSYCEYLGGLYLVGDSAQDTENSLRTVRQASEVMYSGLTSMADAASISCFDMSMNKLSSNEEISEADQELAAFAIEAVDYAFDRYLGRIRALGVLSTYQEYMRPCPVKRPNQMYLARRTRADKLRFRVLTHGLHHRNYAAYEDRSLSQLRSEDPGIITD